MLKRTLVSFTCLSLILSTFAFAAPPTKTWTPEKTVSAQTGPIAQYQGQIVDLGGGKAAIVYFSNRVTNQGSSLLDLTGLGNTPTYDLFVRIVDKYGRTLVDDVKITAAATKPLTDDILDTLNFPLKSNSLNIIADGQGGAIVSYTVSDPNTSEKILMVQRMSSSGTLMWGKNGAGLSMSAYSPSSARIVTDGAGGCYISGLVSKWDLQTNQTYYYGELTWIDVSGNVAGAVADIPSATNTDVINDFEIAAVPKAQNANTGNVYVAYSITDSIAGKAEVRGAVLDSALSYVWGDLKNAAVILMAQDSFYYKDINLAGDADNMYLASNQYDGFGDLTAVNFQKTDFLNGTLSWNNDAETWGQSIALTNPSYVSNADSPALLADGSGGVYGTMWDFDGDTSYNQLKLTGINSDKSPKTTINLQKVVGYAGQAKMVADSEGGIGVVWADGRNAGSSGSSSLDIYAQRVKDGKAMYAANGKNLTVDKGIKVFPSAIFMDDRYFMIYSGDNAFDTAYSTLNLYGIYNSQFALDGTFVNGITERSSSLIDDPGPVANSMPYGVKTPNGYFVVWNDNRNGYPQVFGCKLDNNGNKITADIPFQKSVLDVGAWPVTTVTQDGKYAWVVWSGVPFDANIIKIASMGILSPRPLNALQAQTRVKQQNNRIGALTPRFYCNKVDLATGAKVFTDDIRLGNAYFGMDLLPGITAFNSATVSGGLALVYGGVGGLAGGMIGNQGLNAKTAAVSRKAQPTFGRFPQAGIKTKAPIAAQTYIQFKAVDSGGNFIAGQSSDFPGIPLSDPTQTPVAFSTCTDMAPTIAYDGGSHLIAAWMRQAAKIKSKAGAPLNNDPYLIYGQSIDLADYSLGYPVGQQLTAKTANQADTTLEFHANPNLAYFNGKIGLTWDNLLVDSTLGWTKSRIDAMVLSLTANGGEMLWGPAAITDQKTAYYDSKVDPIWTLDLYPNIKFLNDKFESVVSWMEYNQVASAALGGMNNFPQAGMVRTKGQVDLSAAPTIKAGSLYAMYLGADGAKKLTVPFSVIGSTDKAVVLPTAVDNQNYCSIAYLATTLNADLVNGANEMTFSGLLLAFLSAVYNNTTLVAMQNVGFILPVAPTNFTLTPANDATSLTVKADCPEDYYGSDMYVYNPAGTLVAVLPVSGAKVDSPVTGLQPNTVYQFKLAANSDAGLGAYTPVAEACTHAEGVTGLSMSANVLSWNAPVTNPTLTRYNIARKIANSAGPWEVLSGATFADASATTAFTDVTMSPNETYTYRVIPYNQRGDHVLEGPLLTASLTRSAPAIDKIKQSLSGQQGMTIRSGMYVGDDLLVRIIENNPGGRITQYQVKFTETTTGRSYTWTSAAGVMAATTDGYVTIPVNIPKGTYNMEIITTNDSGLTATKSIIIRKDDAAHVVDNFVTMVSLPSGQAVQASEAGTLNFATLSYQLTKDAPVTLRIVDTGGQVLMSRVIAQGQEGGHVGYNMINWDGITIDGARISRGLKLIQLVVGGKTVTGAALVK